MPSPSQGKRRFVHRAHKPANVVPAESRARRVVRMYEALMRQGWVFRFSALATSPRGFKYQAEGDSPLEAFLKAFGQWRESVRPPTTKPPGQSSAAKEVPTVARRYTKTGIRELCLRDATPPAGPKALGFKIYNRLYMRAYRSRLASAAAVTA